VARQLTRGAARSGVFDRYALIRDDVTTDGAQPQSILLSLSRDELLEHTDAHSEARALAADPDIDHDDVCADVDAAGNYHRGPRGSVRKSDIRPRSLDRRREHRR